MPAPVVRTMMQPLLELFGDDCTEPVSPKPYRLEAHGDPTFMEQVFDLTQRQRIPHVHHDGELDNGRRSLEAAVRISHP